MRVSPSIARLAAYWHRPEVAGRRLDWPAILIFVVVAGGWAFVAAGWGDARLIGGGDAPPIDALFLVAFGPVLGALAAGTIRRGEGNWPVAFLGRDRKWSFAALGVPVLLIGLFGVRRFHVDPHVDAFVFALSLTIAAAAQEIGWREWLFNALGGLPLWASALITCALWLLWTQAAARFGQIPDPGFAAGLLVASFVLAAIVRQTRSSAVAAAWRVAAAAALAGWQIAAIALLLALVTAKAAVTAFRP